MFDLRNLNEAAIRELAVETVDDRRGYTLEFAPNKAQHTEAYDVETTRLLKLQADQKRAERFSEMEDEWFAQGWTGVMGALGRRN